LIITGSVGNVSDSAFHSCSNLVFFNAKGTFGKIGSEAFASCNNLKEVVLPKFDGVIESGAFSGCTKLNSFVAGGHVFSVGSKAFYNCYSLKSLDLPGLKTIKDYAFSGSGLTSFTFEDSVTTIEQFAFSRCSGLTRVVIPSSVTEIGDSSFSSCSELTNVAYQGTHDPGPYAKGVFEGCKKLRRISVPSDYVDELFCGYNFSTGSESSESSAHSVGSASSASSANSASSASSSNSVGRSSGINNVVDVSCAPSLNDRSLRIIAIAVLFVAIFLKLN